MSIQSLATQSLTSERPRAALALGIFLSVGLLAPAHANPPLVNPSFEDVGPDGSPTVNTTVLPGGAGNSAANAWGVFHNVSPSTTRTELLPTTLGGAGSRMLCVETEYPDNGVDQVTGPPNTGPMQGIGSAWVYVQSGVVGMGGGNHGLTGIDVTTSTTGAWEFLQAPNGQMPFNTLLFYGQNGPASFCVEEADILELQGLTPLVPIEYSNALDERAIAGGGGHAGLDSGQVLYTEPIDGVADSQPRDVHDFFPGIEGFEPDAQVDALANGGDGGFQDVVFDEAPLLISLEGDPTADLPIAVFREDVTGVGIHYTQRDLHALDGIGEIEDVDALEMWGGEDGADQPDADYYSLAFDFGASVWFDDGSGAVAVYLTPADIVGAVNQLGFDGSPGDADVDALMVQDTGTVPGTWDEGDAVLFSIRPFNAWDGGEVVYWEFGAAPQFFVHAGHLWDTAFDVAGSFGVDAAHENVDALEAIPLPEPGLAGLLCGVGLLGTLDRRCRRVRRGAWLDAAGERAPEGEQA